MFVIAEIDFAFVVAGATAEISGTRHQGMIAVRILDGVVKNK